jgi:hypothetical protein
MIKLAKINEVLARSVKVLFGFENPGEPSQATTSGIYSRAMKNDVAAVANTASNQRVSLGVLTFEAKTLKDGEICIFARNSSGAVVSSITCYSDGKVKIEGESLTVGNGIDNAVKFLQLNTALQAYNALVAAEFAKIAAVYAPYALVTTPPVLEISGAKSENVKLD